MGGKYSRKEFFKFYPSIIQSYFQGSDSTTPQEVEDIFKISEGRLEELKKNNEKVDLPISMILFDELGIEERSKKNPLKALQSHLEIDGNEKGTSFIGISNQTLDAAKINRALTLSVPDLDSDIDDLKKTSISIAESINDTFGSRPIFQRIIPNVYKEFKANLKLLKKLTVFKEYEIKKFQYLINKYKIDDNFKNINKNVDEYEIFFNENEISKAVQNSKKEEYNKIVYDIFKKCKKNL